MIKVEGGLVEVRGTRIELMSECTCLLHSLLEKGVVDKERLTDMVALSCIAEDTIRSMVIDEIDKMDNIGDALTLLSKLKS